MVCLNEALAVLVVDFFSAEVGEHALGSGVLRVIWRVLQPLLVLLRQVVDLARHGLEDLRQAAAVSYESFIGAEVLIAVLVDNVLERRQLIAFSAMLSVPEDPLDKFLEAVLAVTPIDVIESLLDRHVTVRHKILCLE